MTKRRPSPRKPRPIVVERPQEAPETEVELGVPGMSARFNPQRAAGGLAMGALLGIGVMFLLSFGMTPVYPGFADAATFQNTMAQQKNLMDAQQLRAENLQKDLTAAVQAINLSLKQQHEEVNATIRQLGNAVQARVVQSNITGAWMRYCEATRAGRIGEADAYRAQIAGLQAEYRAYAGADFPLVPC
jgi:hypothetical protein